MTPHQLSDEARQHIDMGRSTLIAMLERFARRHGLSDPSGLEIMREAAEQAHDVRAGLRGARGFEQARDLTSSRITLINDAELEFGLELEHFTRDVKEATESVLAHLHLRYLTLLGGDRDGFHETPVGPETVCNTLSALVESQVLAPAERIRLLEAWRQDLIAELKSFYATLDKAFEAAGIKPKSLKILTKPNPVPTAATTGVANTDLDNLRNALASQHTSAQGTATVAGATAVDANVVLAQLREWMLSQAREHQDDPLSLLSSDTFKLLAPDTATSVEMIERIFRNISVDASVSEPVRAVVLRLRIPLMDRALEGDDLFRSAAQSVQKLIDGIGAIGDTLPLSASTSHPAIHTLDGIVSELLATGALGSASLVRAASAVNAFLDRRNYAANAKLDDAEPLATKAERREAARLLASRALRVLLDGASSAGATDFLSRHWIHVLVNTLYRKGDKHPDWRNNLGIANEISLLGNATTLPEDLRARVELAMRNAKLDAISVSSALNALSSALAQDKGLASATGEIAEAELSTSVASGYDKLFMVHHRGFADTSSRTDSGTMPDIGEWVDLKLPSGEEITGRVQWVGTLRNAGLMCEPDGGRCAIFTRRAIGALQDRGHYQVRCGAKVLERATRAALAQL